MPALLGELDNSHSGDLESHSARFHFVRAGNSFTLLDQARKAPRRTEKPGS